MLKKEIRYTDYSGNEREEDFYFNISRAELTMMEASKVGGLKQYLERIVKCKDNVAIMDYFKDIIHMAYGEKSDDGRRFIKSEELATAFEQTEAYSELVVELLGNPKIASDFINAILPKEIVQAAAKEADIQVLQNT